MSLCASGTSGGIGTCEAEVRWRWRTEAGRWISPPDKGSGPDELIFEMLPELDEVGMKSMFGRGNLFDDGEEVEPVEGITGK